MLRMVSQTWLTIVLVSALLIASSAGILWWQGQQIPRTIRPSGAEEHAGHAVREEQRRTALDLRRAETPLREGEPEAGQFGEDSSWMILAGNSMTELEKQLLSALEQLQQDYSKRLDEWENAFAGMADDVWSYSTENAALNERVTS
ncbi:MbeD family mobilization/exclusion protein [Serratia ureilytica]